MSDPPMSKDTLAIPTMDEDSLPRWMCVAIYLWWVAVAAFLVAGLVVGWVVAIS